MSDINDLRKKYESKLRSEFSEEGVIEAKKIDEQEKSKTGSAQSRNPTPLTSSDYHNFRKESMPAHITAYERLCNFSEKLLKISPDKKTTAALEDAIQVCHLQITPEGAISFSVFAPIAVALSIIVLTYLVPIFVFGSTGSLFFVLFGILAGLAVIMPLQKLPIFLADSWRMKASNQMVLAIFYIVTYMRHTSNLERAISFAAEHLTPPLSLDFKKIIWDVESEKCDNLKESLDNYLLGWKKYNLEFIESMHLIESSLYESSDSRRLDALDKSLKVILDETYEKMLHYAHNLKGPLTSLHMLGIILPILGLVILPLMVSFMPEVRWYHIAVLYNIVLPVTVFYLAKNILSSRPTGYGDSDITDTNPELRKYKSVLIHIGKNELKISPLFIAGAVFALFFLIGALPLILHSLNPNFDIVYGHGQIKVITAISDPDATYYLLGYRVGRDADGNPTNEVIGPYGIGALVLSFFIVIAAGIGIGLYYHLRSKNVIKIREQSKALEQEFASALFQLGNRLADGLPAEIAFLKVSEVMEGTLSGKFFETVSINITKLGMGVEQAIFDPEKGALVYYPSNLIESSMKVLVESSKKGPMIASQALVNVSEYIKQIHRVDERLKDLMADIVSDMRSQVKFLTPAIAGIVVGITSMITQIMGKISEQIDTVQGTLGEQAASSNLGIAKMLGAGGVSTYFFQIIVGLYVIQITYILTVLLNGIENGSDKLSERYMLGNNLIKTAITYVIIALCISVLFNLVAGSILSSFSGG